MSSILVVRKIRTGNVHFSGKICLSGKKVVNVVPREEEEEEEGMLDLWAVLLEEKTCVIRKMTKNNNNNNGHCSISRVGRSV